VTKKKREAGKPPGGGLSRIKARFLKDAGELWDVHEQEILSEVQSSENQKMNISFTAALNLSESTPKLKTAIRFGQATTDSKEFDFDDPNQYFMPEIEEHVKAERTKKVKKFAKDAGIEDGKQDDDAPKGAV